MGIMKWECPAVIRGAEMFEGDVDPCGIYLGHSLESVTTGESVGLWSGWQCSRCGERFQVPCETARYALPLMDDVENEDEPTDAVEATAIALQCAASTVQHDVKIASSAHHYTNHFSSASWEAYGEATDEAARRGTWGRSRYAEAEALIRTGKVPL